MPEYKYYTDGLDLEQVWRWDVDQNVLTYIGVTRVRHESFWSGENPETFTRTQLFALKDVPEWAL